MDRPYIADILSGKDLKKWYWLKAELVAFAKVINVDYVGSKFQILHRLADKLDNKQIFTDNKVIRKSTFNWAKSTLTPGTVITDSYTSGPNTRNFFEEHCGPKFTFIISFMEWMKENAGKNLREAVTEWKRLQQLKKDKSFKSEIPGGNQYNKYLRDFYADNPGKTIQQARHYWKLKRNLPLGKHIYEHSDLKLTKNSRQNVILRPDGRHAALIREYQKRSSIISLGTYKA